MKRPNKIYGRTPTAEEFNALIDYVQSLELTVGGGMEMKRTSAGTVLIGSGGQELDIVEDVQYDTGTGALTKFVRKVKILTLGDAVEEIVFETEEC